MPLTRRQVSALSLTLPFACLIQIPDTLAADDQNALFWRARFASSEAILFGYIRARGDAFPDVIADGKRFIDETSAFLFDFDPAAKTSTTTFNNDDLKPVFLNLPKAAQEELATALADHKGIRSFSELTALELNVLLISEGQQDFAPDAPSLGYSLFMYAQWLNRPMATLVTRDELKALSTPFTLESANAIGPESVIYLLNLRRRVGSIGAHVDKLYGARESGKIAQLGDEMASHGVFDLNELVDIERMRGLLIDRLLALPKGTQAFVTLPIGLLSGPYSICDVLRSRGAEVAAVR